MKSEDPLFDDSFKKCVDFHGHICPGLATGYRAAKAGLEWLRENRAVDEEIVGIVETDACGADAIQVLTGCTFGKGNFIHLDRGKQVFIFLSRDSGKGVRIALRPGALELPERHRELSEKIRDGSASDSEKKEFWSLHQQRARDVLAKPIEALFTIRPVETAIPQKARIEPSVPCDDCGEPTMRSKLNEFHGRMVCGDCREKR